MLIVVSTYEFFYQNFNKTVGFNKTNNTVNKYRIYIYAKNCKRRGQYNRFFYKVKSTQNKKKRCYSHVTGGYKRMHTKCQTNGGENALWFGVIKNKKR